MRVSISRWVSLQNSTAQPLSAMASSESAIARRQIRIILQGDE
jgi:hypothetical protein